MLHHGQGNVIIGQARSAIGTHVEQSAAAAELHRDY